VKQNGGAGIHTYLPLAPQDLQLLLAVSESALHGYAMMKAVEEQSGGALRVELGSLYRMIHRLERDGLIEEAAVKSGEDPAPGRDRRFYRITEFGRAVVAAELERLRGVIELAGARRIRPREASS
jgi:DNA-binding PadR family transcriptional regulator